MELAFPADVPRRTFSRAEFDKMVELGFFHGERVELLYGVLVTMTIGPAHADLVMVLSDLLTEALRSRAYVRTQSPLAASDSSEPEPDIAIVPRTRYRSDHPSRALLVIEVADSTLEKDRQIKARLYAEMAIPEYWVVDVEGEAIEVFTQPSKGRYRKSQKHGRGKTLAPSAFPDVRVAVDDLFG